MLQEANLQGAIFHGTNLQNAYFEKANLRKANLINANLHGAWLGSFLPFDEEDGADLRGAIFFKTNLEDAELTRADLRGVDLRHAEGLTQEQVEEAIGDEETKLPKGLRQPKNWTPNTDV
jgi:uncharacterized protein YjbI with pentapeptide repeats